MGRTIRKPAALLRYGMLSAPARKATAKLTQRSTRSEFLAKRPRYRVAVREEPMEDVMPGQFADNGDDSEDGLGVLVPDVPQNNSTQSQTDGREEVQGVALSSHPIILRQERYCTD